MFHSGNNFHSGNSNDLFVHVSWKTRAGEPTFTCDELRQTAFTAIRTLTRGYLCHVLAMNGTNNQVGIVFQVPASLPVSQVARMSMKGSDQAITRFRVVFQSEEAPVRNFWAADFTTRSLSAAEASEAEAYLRGQMASWRDLPEAAYGPVGRD